ncbi:solute carrier family 25 member 43-like [Hippocampus zosterae]|uniref:solute carrier family 25 member 43-like n=1 Tax=Hippocampus zosterae TaxID=109293 RepID=UPI00223CB98F|nr:solute carrier family 25 member 43-like [Hippocampus zosterae]
MPEDKEFRPWLIACLSSLGFLAGDVLSYPLDTVITRMRVQKTPLTLLQTFQKIVREEGPRQLFRGISLSTMTAFVPSVIYFGVYESLMFRMSQLVDRLNSEKSSLVDSFKMAFPLAVACVAEALSLVVNVPFDLVRTRIQSGEPGLGGRVWQVMGNVVRQEGLARPYKSSHIYIVCALSFTGLQFQFLEMFRYFLTENMATVLASTALATVLTNPLDFVMTRHVLLKSDSNSLRVGALMRKMAQ